MRDLSPEPSLLTLRAIIGQRKRKKVRLPKRSDDLSRCLTPSATPTRRQRKIICRAITLFSVRHIGLEELHGLRSTASPDSIDDTNPQEAGAHSALEADTLHAPPSSFETNPVAFRSQICTSHIPTDATACYLRSSLSVAFCCRNGVWRDETVAEKKDRHSAEIFIDNVYCWPSNSYLISPGRL